ncbi:hypothetical protein B566_EDAN011499 [Ephemera danica]|nr:hypothetical protein B566_EDAN011499 [Ephemera danica]
MGKKTPPEDLVIPPQDSRICGTICVCQMTAVLSSVALVYLTVAIYMPALRAFSSNINEKPVMCMTTRSVQKDNCSWASCGEWCLSKSSGACTQIFVNLRRNGSNLIFYNCSNSANKTCYGINENAKKSRCIVDDCKNLTGTFNCTKGTCINITDAFECMFTETEAPLKCSGRRGKITCIAMDGLHDCNRGTCAKIRPPYNCDRRCVDIPTRNKNVILLNRDNVYLSHCLRATAIEDEGEEEVYSWEKEQVPQSTGTAVGPTTSAEDPTMHVAMASCFEIMNTSRGIEATDCINGSLVPKLSLTDLTNFTYLLGLSAQSSLERPLDKTGRITPIETDLIIANESRLQINLEGCVNSLRNECFAFIRDYGKDGTDHNARARFPCFYADHDPTMAIFKFDLQTTYQDFLIAAIVPSVLFVVSCTVLVTCQKSVEVGDDAKMRFKGCGAVKSNSTPGNVGNGGPAEEEAEGGGGPSGIREDEEEEGAAFPSYPRSRPPTTTRHPRYWLSHTLATVARQPLSRQSTTTVRGERVCFLTIAFNHLLLYATASFLVSVHVFELVTLSSSCEQTRVALIRPKSCSPLHIIKYNGLIAHQLREIVVSFVPECRPRADGTVSAAASAISTESLHLKVSADLSLVEQAQQKSRSPSEVPCLTDRFYTPAASTPSAGAAGSLGSRLGALSGSTYERVGEEHPQHTHLADLAEHYINPHHAQPPHPDTTDETDDDANPEAARRKKRLKHHPRKQAAAMGALGPDGLPVVSLMEKAKFYTSLCFGTTAILAVFGFLFLIPFIVDPAISSLAADFDPRAVTCVVSSFERALGLRNCSWSSCREGCTTAALKCTLVRVNYSEHYFDQPNPTTPLNFSVTDTKFFINTEGCGYPPRVNCTEFANKYQLVVAEYSWEKTVRNLVLALAVPPLIFGFTVGVLIFWYCPACSKDKQEEHSDGEELQVEDEEY